jgi:surfeit locus 1 family protein
MPTTTVRRPFFMALTLALTGLVLAALLALGTWQVQRLHWKEGLLATIAARVGSPPVGLAEVERRLAADGDVEYLPMRAEGRFLHSGERHFFATWQGQSGYYVYTPLQLDDGRFLFVNRGFVPFDRKDPATRPQSQPEGRVGVEGLARGRLSEKPSFIVPESDPAANLFYWKDLDAMTSSAGLPAGAVVLPFFMDAGDAPNEGGLPVGGVTLIDLPNSHLQYAVTWYGLAAALIGVVAFWLVRQSRPSNP